jgi:O-antigen/teichoic acid export membrane protein
MFKKIAGTLITKVLSAAISFLLVVLTAKLLGAEVRGHISLIILGVSINAMVSQVAGGPTLVYLISRLNSGFITLTSYTWAIACCYLLSHVLTSIGFVPEAFFWPVFFTSLLQSLGFIHTSILLGKEQIAKHNLITLLQYLSHLASFLVFYFIGKEENIGAFIYGLYISNLLLWALSIAWSAKYISIPEFTNLKGQLKTLFTYGFTAQAATLAHLLSIRVSFYFINMYEGAATVGIFSTGVSVTEAILLIGTSINMVFYSHVSNSANAIQSQEMAVKMAKISFLLSIPALVLLSALSPSVYSAIFGPEFTMLPQIIRSLSPGLAALSFYMVYSSYYAGTGKYHVNAAASGISLAVTTIGSYLLIPRFGILGAGWVCSFAYIASAIFYLLLFSGQAKMKVVKLLPSPVKEAKQYFNLIINRR